MNIKLKLKYLLNRGVNQRIFVFSDPHYGHKNIVRGVSEWRDKDGNVEVKRTRDFTTLEKMNSAIVNNINEVVGQDDILICLGDWAFGGHENIGVFRERIICKNLIHIVGNHDDHLINDKYNYSRFFTSIHSELHLTVDFEFNPHTTIYQKFTRRFFLHHYPCASWRDLKDGVIHLHGHNHLPSNLKMGHKGKYIDVGIDGNDFKPYDLLDIVKIMETQEIGKLVLPFDHHEL